MEEDGILGHLVDLYGEREFVDGVEREPDGHVNRVLIGLATFVQAFARVLRAGRAVMAALSRHFSTLRGGYGV